MPSLQLMLNTCMALYASHGCYSPSWLWSTSAHSSEEQSWIQHLKLYSEQVNEAPTPPLNISEDVGNGYKTKSGHLII